MPMLICFEYFTCFQVKLHCYGYTDFTIKEVISKIKKLRQKYKSVKVFYPYSVFCNQWLRKGRGFQFRLFIFTLDFFTLVARRV